MADTHAATSLSAFANVWGSRSEEEGIGSKEPRMTPGPILRLSLWVGYVALAVLIGWAAHSTLVFFALLGAGLVVKAALNQRRSMHRDR